VISTDRQEFTSNILLIKLSNKQVISAGLEMSYNLCAKIQQFSLFPHSSLSTGLKMVQYAKKK